MDLDEWEERHYLPGLVVPHRAVRASTALLLVIGGRQARACVGTQLERVGLGWLEMTLLCVVERVGGLSQQALAERALVDRTRVSAAVRELEREGLVVRGPGLDGRQVRVTLTDAGRRWTREGVEELRRAERKLLPRLRESERERLRALLEKGLVRWA